MNKRATQSLKLQKVWEQGGVCLPPPPPPLNQNHACTWSKMKFVTLECDKHGESVQGIFQAILNRNDLLDLVSILVPNWAGRTIPYISSIQ